MSCYIVEEKTIDRILTELNKDENKWLLYILKGGDYKTCYMSDDDFYFYGRKLWKMNRLNCGRRYPKQRAETTKIENVYAYAPVYCDSKMQFYKTLTCFLYQCCDSDLITNTKLYKAMKEIKNQLAGNILRETKEYQNCKWE